MSGLKSEESPVDHSLLRDYDSVLFMVILGFIWFSQRLVIHYRGSSQKLPSD